MEAGKLRHYVTIQAPTEKRDTHGGVVHTWLNVAVNIPARVEPLEGREYFDAMKVNGEVTHRVTMRYRNGLSSRSRLVHDGRTLDVVSTVSSDERRVKLVLMCRELT